MSKWKMGNCEALKALLYVFLPDEPAFDQPKCTGCEYKVSSS